MIAIPKTAKPERLAENRAAIDHPLDAAAMAQLDAIFPPPTGPQPLEMI